MAERTTIKIGGLARFLFLPSALSELKEFLPRLVQDYPLYYLGGGSNTIFGNFNGVVVSSQLLKGFRILEESEEGVLLEVLAGTPLRELLPLILEKNLCGLETLLGIPPHQRGRGGGYERGRLRAGDIPNNGGGLLRRPP